MVIKRREFLQVGSLATASLMVPKFLKAFEGRNMLLPGNKVLVILQLSGGNDGLNTVIPPQNNGPAVLISIFVDRGKAHTA